jgi:hypothetical protein
MAIKQIKSMVQFTRGSSLVWDSLVTPIPDGVVTFAIDSGDFKLGDGVTLYSALPVLFTYADLVAAQGGISSMFEEPTIEQNGNIAVVSFDVVSNTVKYAVSDTSLASLLSSIQTLETDNTNQDAAIANLLAAALSIDVSINTAANGNVVTISDRRYSNSGNTVDTIRNQVNSMITYEPGSHLGEPVFYCDINKKNKADKHKLQDGNTYYVDVVGFNNKAANTVYGITAANTSVVITNISGSLFSVKFNNVTNGVKDDVPIALTVSVDDGTGYSVMKKVIGCLVQRQRILVGIYGTGIYNGGFYGCTIDSKGNIFAVGQMIGEGPSPTTAYNALIVKFDANLNILVKKSYGGDKNEILWDIDTDSYDNVFVVGLTYSTGVSGFCDAWIVKFNNNLNKVNEKIYSGSGVDGFQRLVLDNNDNIYVVGYTTSEGQGGVEYGDALIVKFDNNLNILARKIYGSTGDDRFTSINFDNNDNIIAVGYVTPDIYAQGLIIKFDSNLNIIAKKTYGGATGHTYFRGVDVDINGNLFIVGSSTVNNIGGTTYGDCLIVKLDADLNYIKSKKYGGSDDDSFNSVITDKFNNVIVSGHSKSSSLGGTSWGDGIITKFDNDLNLIFGKSVSSSVDDRIIDVKIDENDNLITCGFFKWNTSAVLGASIIKFPSSIPGGTFTGTNITSIVIRDTPDCSLADDGLVLAETNLTFADSALTLTTTVPTTFSLIDSAQTYLKEIIN